MASPRTSSPTTIPAPHLFLCHSDKPVAARLVVAIWAAAALALPEQRARRTLRLSAQLPTGGFVCSSPPASSCPATIPERLRATIPERLRARASQEV